jgi:hypothetical protein
MARSSLATYEYVEASSMIRVPSSSLNDTVREALVSKACGVATLREKTPPALGGPNTPRTSPFEFNATRVPDVWVTPPRTTVTDRDAVVSPVTLMDVQSARSIWTSALGTYW